MEEEKELFEDYELKGWKLTPKIYKILGVAATFEILVFVVIGQFNLLSTKACDNAYVGKVCEVLDAAYIGTTFLNDGWVKDDKYAHTKFEEMDETFVDVTNEEPPFTYPEGYFADREITQVIPPDIDQFPTDPTEPSPINPIPPPSFTPPKNLQDRKQVLPKPNKTKVDLPDSILGDTKPTPDKTPGKKDPKDPKDIGKPGDNSNTTAKNGKDGATKEPLDDEALLSFKPNQQPLDDFREAVKKTIVKDKVDLKAPFSITIDGVLTPEGKLDSDPKKTHYINPQGDQKMVDMAKSAIEAVNASGLFSYLNKLGGKRVIITLQQDQDNFTALLKSKIETEEKAKTLASGFRFLLTAGKKLREGKDEAVLLNSATVSNDGSNFIINFAVPQQTAQELIQKQLTAPPAPAPTEQNTTGQTTTNPSGI